MRVKICGLRRDEDIVCVNETLPEYVGFVFVPGTKRFVEPLRAARLVSMLDSSVIPVGVFRDQSVDDAASCAAASGIRAVQLHGTEDNGYISALRSRLNIEIIKAFRADEAFSAESVINSAADMVLIDGGAGDGKTFDWSLLSGIDRQYFLAGGINADNARDAMSVTPAPFALDTSSGVETGGYKDCEKIKRLINLIRS